MRALLILVSFFGWVTSLADEGPLQDPLRVVQTYVGDADDRIYFRFNEGSMPGCYGNSGGRLYKDDPFYSVTYAQLLMIIATGGIKGKVIFENQAGPGWSVCKIKGLQLFPS